MVFVDHRIVDDMQSLGLTLMVVTGEGGVFSGHQEIVGDERIPLNLHDAIIAAIAEIVFDSVDGAIVGSIGDDARIVAIVDEIVANRIAPRSLFDFDAISLGSEAIEDVITRDHALAHPHMTMVTSQVHPFRGTTSIVDGIVDQVEERAVVRVCAEADIGGVMNMAMIHDEVVAGPDANAVTTTANFQSLKDKILKGRIRFQTDVQNILTIV